jgi:hypothetical protein
LLVKVLNLLTNIEIAILWSIQMPHTALVEPTYGEEKLLKELKIVDELISNDRCESLESYNSSLQMLLYRSLKNNQPRVVATYVKSVLELVKKFGKTKFDAISILLAKNLVVSNKLLFTMIQEEDYVLLANVILCSIGLDKEVADSNSVRQNDEISYEAMLSFFNQVLEILQQENVAMQLPHFKEVYSEYVDAIAAKDRARIHKQFFIVKTKIVLNIVKSDYKEISDALYFLISLLLEKNIDFKNLDLMAELFGIESETAFNFLKLLELIVKNATPAITASQQSKFINAILQIYTTLIIENGFALDLTIHDKLTERRALYKDALQQTIAEYSLQPLAAYEEAYIGLILGDMDKAFANLESFIKYLQENVDFIPTIFPEDKLNHIYQITDPNVPMFAKELLVVQKVEVKVDSSKCYRAEDPEKQHFTANITRKILDKYGFDFNATHSLESLNIKQKIMVCSCALDACFTIGQEDDAKKALAIIKYIMQQCKMLADANRNREMLEFLAAIVNKRLLAELLFSITNFNVEPTAQQYKIIIEAALQTFFLQFSKFYGAPRNLNDFMQAVYIELGMGNETQVFKPKFALDLSNQQEKSTVLAVTKSEDNQNSVAACYVPC